MQSILAAGRLAENDYRLRVFPKIPLIEYTLIRRNNYNSIERKSGAPFDLHDLREIWITLNSDSIFGDSKIALTHPIFVFSLRAVFFASFAV